MSRSGGAGLATARKKLDMVRGIYVIKYVFLGDSLEIPENPGSLTRSQFIVKIVK